MLLEQGSPPSVWVGVFPEPIAQKLSRLMSGVTAHDFYIALSILSIRFPSEQVFLLVRSLCLVPLYAPKAAL